MNKETVKKILCDWLGESELECMDTVLFASASALYKYCSDWHGGQDDSLYAIESELISPPISFRPSCFGELEDDDLIVYGLLEDKTILPHDLLEFIKSTPLTSEDL